MKEEKLNPKKKKKDKKRQTKREMILHFF